MSRVRRYTTKSAIPSEHSEAVQLMYLARLHEASAPKYQHGSFESADCEAKRLAELHHGVTFVVLSAVRAYSTPPAVIEVQIISPEDAF